MHNKHICKIAIMGCGGSGKSTLAKQLGKLLNLPVYHLDRYYWLPGWKEIEIEKFKITHRNIYLQSRWIIDGNQTRVMKERLEHAELIIFLDRPLWLCLWRVIKRWFMNRNKSRSDLGSNCKDKLTWKFLHYIWIFRKRYQPKIMATLTKLKTQKKIYILKTNSDISNLLIMAQELKAIN